MKLSHRLPVILAATLIALPGLAQAGAKLRYSISVYEFANEAGWNGHWNVGDGFKTMMTHALNESENFIVLGDEEMRDAAMGEQDKVATGRMAGGKKAPQMGRMTPAQLLVRGSITHVQNETTGGSGGLNFQGIKLGGSSGKAEINMTIYLVDTETGQVKASTEVIGESGRKGLGVGYYGSALNGLTGDMAGFKNDNVGKATADAVAKSVEFLNAQLENIPWEGSIIMAGAKTIMNRGSREGVAVGNVFRVGEVEELVDPDTGEVLDVSMTEVGKVKVTEVKEKIAYLEAVSGAGKIAKGMSVLAK